MTKDEIATRQRELQDDGYYEDFRSCEGTFGPFTLAAEMNAHVGTTLGAPGRKLAIAACAAAHDQSIDAHHLRAIVPQLVEALTHGPLHCADPAVLLTAAMALTLRSAA